MGDTKPVQSPARVDIKSLDLAGIEQLMSGMGKEKYRALQVYKWLWQQGARDFDQMTNISKVTRQELARKAGIGWLESAGMQASSDGTR
ncbi:MAG: hypothetical protein QGG40_08900, partial [Myxococcota bacterium]|nr:hypothetical protein [Myxococcota bacterium]